MLALLGAVREEIVDLQRHIAPEESFAEPDYRAYKGKYHNKDILLAQTGLGRERAEMATRFILEHYPITTLVSLGFAGALTEELRVGDIIICSTLHCGDGRVYPGYDSDKPCSSDANLVSLTVRCLENTSTRFCEGSSVTMTRLVSMPKAKQTLGRAFRADIVDMESYWIGRIASDRQIPFIAVRAVSDTMRDSLPPFDLILNANGKWQRKKATLYFISHPQQLIKMIALYQNTRQARRSLTTFVGNLMANI